MNAKTLGEQYPLPRTEDMFDALGGIQYFTTLDATTMYWQLPLREKDRHRTAFATSIHQAYISSQELRWV